MTKTYSKTRILVECALMIAVGTVLAQIKIFEMPNGGSVTLLSMLPFILVSFRHGIQWGVATGFVNSLLQMLFGFYAPPSNTVWALVGMILLDYVLAFSALGLANLFAKPFHNRMMGVAAGCVAVCFLRFVCSYLSTVFVWFSTAPKELPLWLFGITYNGAYMLPELIFTTLGACILYKTAPQLFEAK